MLTVIVHTVRWRNIPLALRIALVLKLAIRGSDRVQVDPEVGGELAHRGQGSPFTQLAARDQRLDAVGHLSIDGTAVGGVDCQGHRSV